MEKGKWKRREEMKIQIPLTVEFHLILAVLFVVGGGDLFLLKFASNNQITRTSTESPHLDIWTAGGEGPTF
jgi:mRNA-degrading endonuclease HigB of HigAB toxin-antitoxin module